jgi:hypothetical protein
VCEQGSNTTAMHQLPHVMNMQVPLQLYTCIASSAGKIHQLQPLGLQLLFTEHSSSCATAACLTR